MRARNLYTVETFTMALDDIYQAQYFITADDKVTCVNQYYYEKVPRIGTIAEVTSQLAIYLDNAFWTVFWQPDCAADYSYDKTVVQKIFPTRDAPVQFIGSQGEFGAGIGNAMNGTTAVLIAQYGQAWSANFRGRMYLTGLLDTGANFGRITTALRATINSRYDSTFDLDIVLGGPASVTMHECVFSPSRAKPPGDPPPPPILPVFSEVATNIVRPRIATQRRRRTPVAATI